MVVSTVVLAAASVLSGPFPPAQKSAEATYRELAAPGSPAVARVWTETRGDGREVGRYALAADGETFAPPRRTDWELRLRAGRFDPLRGSPPIPEGLAAADGARLRIVQLWSPSFEGFRAELRRHGAEVLAFLPDHAHLVALDAEDVAGVRGLAFVRAVTPFHPAFKLDEALLAAVVADARGEVRVHLLTARRGGHGPVEAWIERRGGVVEHASRETYLMRARVRYEELAALAALDDVQWIEPWGEPGTDIDIAKIFHGAVALEQALGLRGRGIRVEVMDQGVDLSHPAFTSFVIHNGNSPSAHGTATAGLVVGNGAGEPPLHGVMPEATLVVGDFNFPWSGGSRYAHTAELVDPELPYRAVLQSNSWGSSRTAEYTAISANMDLIAFDVDRLSFTQSMGNSGYPVGRPEGWAKNVISVGGIHHLDTLTTADDFWQGATNGPASDGRIKPDLASFYDFVSTTAMGGGYQTTFGGNSAATAITGGHVGLVYSLWDLGLFGNPNGGTTPFENAPFNTTIKALAINTAGQWPFSGVAHNLTRTNQGWGWIDLERMLELSDEMIVVDETDVLAMLESTSRFVEVAAGTPELRATLVYRDPPGVPSSVMHRVNDLDLAVVSPSGVVYNGNWGLLANTTSVPGGDRDVLNTVENVWVAAPEAGTWEVVVTAVEVNQDAHVETPGDDVDYALVVSGIEVERPPKKRRAPTSGPR